MHLLLWPTWGAFFLPVVLVFMDLFLGLRARHKRCLSTTNRVEEDFEILVPIYGSVDYLENVEYLRQYGARVVLCTTTTETAEFDSELDRIAARNGFRISRSDVPRKATSGKKRATAGTVRDRVIRDAHAVLSARWVVCIDADTVTDVSLGHLVASMRDNDVDVVSVRLLPLHRGSLLGHLQVHEYRSAMLLRRISPWMVSGACHAARREAHHAIMIRHSLFFQGNDVEVGLLARALGYRVGHVAFDVPTTVPERFRPWWRQRLAWAGGEVRLFLANPQIVRRHPVFWLFGAVLTIGGLPFRWYAVLHPGWPLATMFLGYVVFSLVLHRNSWDRWLLLLPIYGAISSLIITPLGLVTYVHMALADRNAGLIRTRLPGVRIPPRRSVGGPRHATSAARGLRSSPSSPHQAVARARVAAARIPVPGPWNVLSGEVLSRSGHNEVRHASRRVIRDGKTEARSAGYARHACRVGSCG